MKIVVCIKQVPATNDAKIDPETKRIVREGLKAILNPFDTYAVEEAIQLRDKFGGEVIALSMGPEKASNSLREAISVGADKAILLSDRAFGGSDTWATSYALAKAIEKIGDVDLVICGKQAIDGDTAQVGPGIAAHLDWFQATYVMGVEDVTSKTIKVKRMHEDGYDICEMDFPAVLTVLKDINVPRVPTLKGRMASRKAEIPVWGPLDIGAEIEKIGLSGSPTRVVKTSPPPPRNIVTQKVEGSPEDCAKQLVRELRLRSVL
ncbi:electron transfer flavoprotein subunit beta/FixA family protein [archaeon]|nr:electron transfer flavoprotein subunit beta/FixA family protein [archaeon]